MTAVLKNQLLSAVAAMRNQSSSKMSDRPSVAIKAGSAEQAVGVSRPVGTPNRLRERPVSSVEPWLQTILRPVVLFYNGKGDHILALPALRALAALFPGRLTLICRHGVHQVFFSELHLGRVLEAKFWHESGRGHQFNAKAVAEGIEECDLFVSLVPWHGDAMDRLLEHLAPSFSVGFHPHLATLLHMDFTKHAVDSTFSVAKYLNPLLELEDYSGPPVFPNFARDAARRLRALVPTPMRVLAVHPETDARKAWPVEHCASVLDRFLGRHPDFVAWIITLADLSLDKGQHGDRVIPCSGLPIDIAMSLVSEADYFVGIDSCLLHVADFCRVPGVGLFGPTSSARWGFRVGPHRHVCDGNSVSTIPVDDVCDALESLLVAEFTSAAGPAEQGAAPACTRSG